MTRRDLARWLTAHAPTGRTIATIARYAAAIAVLWLLWPTSHVDTADDLRDRMAVTAARTTHHRADSLGKQYRVDTVRLRVVRAHTDTVLAAITDTVIHVDTVRALIADERHACSVVIATCEQRAAVSDSLARLADTRRRLAESRIPSKWARVRSASRWFLIGAGVGAIAGAVK